MLSRLLSGAFIRVCVASTGGLASAATENEFRRFSEGQGGGSYDWEGQELQVSAVWTICQTHYYSLTINVAFAILRTLIPTEPADRKLSKIETLRLACSYISHLGALLVSGSCDKAHKPNESSSRRAQVCTFCVASTKKNHLKHGP